MKAFEKKYGQQDSSNTTAAAGPASATTRRRPSSDVLPTCYYYHDQRSATAGGGGGGGGTTSAVQEEHSPLIIRNHRSRSSINHHRHRRSSSPAAATTSTRMLSLFATTCVVAFVSALISHFVTVYFYASSTASSLSLHQMKTARKQSSDATKMQDAQQFASESLRIYLVEPSLTSELYYYNYNSSNKENYNNSKDLVGTSKNASSALNTSSSNSGSMTNNNNNNNNNIDDRNGGFDSMIKNSTNTTTTTTVNEEREEPTTSIVALPPHPPPPEHCEATLMLLRHCEGGVAREHCGYMGYQRSQYLATLFGKNGKWPAPSYIIAMAEGERHNPVVKNWREIETVQPLAEKFNMTMDVSYGFPEKKQLMEYLYSLLRTGAMCGKLAVLSWKHHDIPHFSHGMGCGPDQGCPMSFGDEEYDKVWQIKYSYHRQMHAPYVIEDNSTKAIKKHQHQQSWGEHPRWFVYGTVQSETFDPLQFSAAQGVYENNR